VTELRADCSRCAGLCCAVPAFSASSDFAIDKPSHTPCPNLADDFGCSIHADLRGRGFPGCTVYECFGAGQRVVQELYDGRDWLSAPEVRQEMFAAFEVVERLHELLWYLQDALARPAVATLRDELEGLCDGVDAACRAPVPGDVAPFQLRADGLLGEASRLVRAGSDGPDLRGRDLSGQDLRGRELTGASLRGAVLIGADLRDHDLGPADLLGADLRAADVAGTDLSDALFLTQFQVNAARGDAATRLPDRLARPPYWRVR
jgi:Pentapeptide repeats (8 copies)